MSIRRTAERAQRDRRRTAVVVCSVLGAGIAAALVAALCSGQACRSFGIWIAVGGAAAAVGTLLGFLFGVPKAVSGDDPAGDEGEGGKEEGEAPRGARSRTRVNTNLEQISDWLTKILLGAGLVQIGALPGAFERLARYCASGFGTDVPHARAVTLGLILYFLIAGFFAGYLLTRMALSQMFAYADWQLGNLFSEVSDELKSEPEFVRGGEEQAAVRLPAGIAARIRSVPLFELNSAEECRLWAQAQLEAGDNERAEMGYRLALEYAPDDSRLLEGLAVVLAARGQHGQSLRALEEMQRSAEAGPAATVSVVERKALAGMIFNHLYEPEPHGFTRALEKLSGYPFTGTRDDARILVYKAAALGQQYRYLRRRKKSADLLSRIEREALDAVERALTLDSGWLGVLRGMLDAKYRRKGSEDDDLEMFAKSAEFRAALEI